MGIHHALTSMYNDGGVKDMMRDRGIQDVDGVMSDLGADISSDGHLMNPQKWGLLGPDQTPLGPAPSGNGGAADKD
eukprot:6690386-Pyramimonas_sp.AAC.1